MDCKHEHLRCTNNVFFCLDCGAEVPNPYKADKQAGQKEAPSEGPQKPVKRKTKKGAEKS